MQQKKLFTSIGLMSGTSMDGVDLALIKSDGKNIIEDKKFAYFPYEKSIKEKLRNLIYGKPSLEEIKIVEQEFTLLNAQIVEDFLSKNKIDKSEIDIISFHGHTILHLPEKSITWQIGNWQLLAAKTKINVVADFRTRDVAFGGQGAPLVPIYHFHLFSNQPRPAAVLNIGGISNITYFASDFEDEIEAFDVCFGNAPLDDLVKAKLGLDYDKDGEIAKKGEVDFILADKILQNEIFHKSPPKSFDRNDFEKILAPINNLKIEDALATLAYIHARAIAISIDLIAANNNKKPHAIFVCGGGRKNHALIDAMKKWIINVEVKIIEEIGFNGDAIEAEAFAFLGIRSLLNLPISFQKTTGISQADNCALASPQRYSSSCGGVFYRA